MITKLREDWGLRPWWMNGLFYFCCYMTFIYMPFDLFLKPVAEDHEIWFGFSLTGWWAKASEPLHWAIYAAGLMVSGECGVGCGLGHRCTRVRLLSP